VEHSAGVYDLWDEGVPTLVHGDAHVGNLFADGEAAGFLDWACLSRTPGLRDVSYFLSNSIESELRRAHEKDLLRLYLDALGEAGVAEPPDFEESWRRHRRHVAYSWVAAATTLAMGDRWQPLAAGRRAVERTTAALTDLGTVELLREELGL
jgi:aminoglycoside phosphotransferase (APT) family kinase protein